MSGPNKDLLQLCQSSIRRGSKTFAFASLFFGREEAVGAKLLYIWCRHCDDEIDNVERPQQAQRWQELARRTAQALTTDDAVPAEFQALRWVIRKYGIPHEYPLELLRGMKMDVDEVSYETFADLQVYCYRVAGVVGLMMAHIMGVNDAKALRAACDLGLAMQLTNCARDVRTDWKMGRVYLPLRELAAQGISREDFFSEPPSLIQNPEAVFAVTVKMLKMAEELYRSGEDGVVHLSGKSSLVILVARFSYSRIGDKILRLGFRAWQKRVFTSRAEKLICLSRALGVWCRQWPQRKKFSRIETLPVWRLPC